MIRDSDNNEAPNRADPVAVDGRAGGKYVLRHCNIKNAFTLTHGTESGAPWRGGYAVEVYGNTYEYDGSTGGIHTAHFIRAGAALFYDNIVGGTRGYHSAVKFWLRREHEAWGKFGRCDGTHSWDGSGAPAGYPALDQPGRGQAASNVFELSQPQELAPVRIWNNTISVQGACGGTSEIGGVICNNNPNYVRRNRDYYFSNDASGALSGYAAYDYPHPLTDGVQPDPPDSVAPASPTNLIAQ